MRYMIKQGDTLSELAKTYGTSVSELVRLNNIPDPDKIFAGDELYLPDTPNTLWYALKRFLFG